MPQLGTDGIFPFDNSTGAGNAVTFMHGSPEPLVALENAESPRLLPATRLWVEAENSNNDVASSFGGRKASISCG